MTSLSNDQDGVGRPATNSSYQLLRQAHENGSSCGHELPGRCEEAQTVREAKRKRQYQPTATGNQGLVAAITPR